MNRHSSTSPIQIHPLRVLLVGGGGREHALAWRISQSPDLGRLLVAPGNPGPMGLPKTECLATIPATDLPALIEVVRREQIDLVVVGPEAPLCAGLRDAIEDSFGDKVAVFGPSQRAAEIESSKAFAKDFMVRHGIPTAAHRVLSQLSEVEALPEGPLVVKADGLCAGKGVTLCHSRAEAIPVLASLLAPSTQTPQTRRAVVEQWLHGREVSVLALATVDKTGDVQIAVLPPCEDHKTIGEGDTGPMTGGMGAICPTDVLHPEDPLLPEVVQTILKPTAENLAREGRPFVGVLYAGLMRTPSGPKVLEFNCRFGDPETQVLVRMIADDLLPWLYGTARGILPASKVAVEPGAACGVVLASAGYPEEKAPSNPALPAILTGADPSPWPRGVQVFHAGTYRDPQGVLRAGSGRVLCVTAKAEAMPIALQLSYEAASLANFPGTQYRRDIGRRQGDPRP